MKVFLAGSFVPSTRGLLESVARDRGHAILEIDFSSVSRDVPKGTEVIFLMARESQLPLVRVLAEKVPIIIIDPCRDDVARVVRFLKAGATDVLQLPYNREEANAFFSEVEAL